MGDDPNFRIIELAQRVVSVCDILDSPGIYASFERERALAWVQENRAGLARLGRTSYTGSAAARHALKLWKANW